MKVVWICHFTNEEVQKYIKLYGKREEFAPWIPNLIRGFESLNDIDLHVISPHFLINKFTKFKLRKVNYYFIPAGVPILHKNYPNFLPLNAFCNYFLFNRRVKKIVTKINPDIINLIGAENAYYSSSILQFDKIYPVIVTIQGFISEIKSNNVSLKNIFRAKTEIEILKRFKYFIGEEDSEKYIKRFNNSFNFFLAYFPTNETLIEKVNSEFDNNKQFDCIYFGRLDDTNKGTIEFVNIINETKNLFPQIKAVMIGHGSSNYICKQINKLNCENNVQIFNFAKNQLELFKIVKKSKIVIVPSLFDRLPSTIRESMMLKVPVIAYKTGGIPNINKERENIIIVEKGDYKKAAAEIYGLLNNKTRREKIIYNAYDFAVREFSLNINVNRILEAYNKTIRDFKV
jgi:glycosyltransferase involved in cell wall biosynthesis